MIAATTVDTEEKLRLLSYLIIAPLTPNQFRTLVENHDDFVFIGILFDNILRTKMRKNKRMRPLLAEGLTMKEVKAWWLNNLNEEVKEKLEQIYYAGMPIFTINLERNFPYGTNNPWQCMQNGCPLYDLPRLLKTVISPEAAQEIIKQIEGDHQGEATIYEVRIAPNTPGSNLFSIAVVKQSLPP